MNRQPDMRQLMKQAQQMQQEMMAAQSELAQQQFTGTAGGGLVTATVSGSQELLEVKISPEDVEMLEDLVVAAVRQAMEEAATAASDRLGGLAGGLGGLFG